MIKTIVTLVFCHLIGDYVLQTNFLATTKGENWYHLIVHCILYTVPFCVVFGIGWQFAVLLGTHIVIDTLKARLKKISYFQDQALHYLISLIYLL